MSVFHFRFEPILNLRRRERDDAGEEVRKANEAIARVRQQIDEIQEQRDELRKQAAQTIQPKADANGSARLKVDQMLQQGRYDLQLAAEQAALQKTIETLQTELERRRDLLIAAEADVKRLERLRETQLREHRYHELKTSQKEADDLTSARLANAKLRQQRAATQGQSSEGAAPSEVAASPIANRISLSRWAEEQSS